MTPRFKFQVNDTVTSKTLPIELLDKGFVNNSNYRVRFGWLTDVKQAYYIVQDKTNLIIQSADGIATGYSEYFSTVQRDKS
jgi:hypothetical protein